MANLIASMLKGRAPLLGWFGKLPTLGDFAGKALPLSLCNQIHTWCEQGMDDLAQKQGENWKDAYQLAPVWHFVMNAHVWDARPLMGCIAPSMDKIGRYSPVLALRTIENTDIKRHLPPYSYWQQRTEALLRQVVRGELCAESIQAELQTALMLERKQSQEGLSTSVDIPASVNTGGLSWLDLPLRFSERKKRSFWWVEPSLRSPLQQITHTGTPDEALFTSLMAGWISNNERSLARRCNESR